MTIFPAALILVYVAIATPPRIAPPDLMPFLKVVSASAGAPGRIACRDLDLAMRMKQLGLSPDAKAPVAWAATADQLRDYLAEGKLVVAGDAALLEAGAGVAIVLEKGKPTILVNTRNVQASGIVLSDAFLKIARVR
ncbi:hypothetical protein [Mesoterricola silvestris]|uniref:Uncharacterized protein n=1 Tax=Mesoterricola silvestris TaxID=2927979 RepID=A0AA48KA62_9BACT|nr:hypothetical protein [Mesoterricola silvestris]BDU72997.1 hypothetical protein METEAL_21710 [Mesoterricola silvestris]